MKRRDKFLLVIFTVCLITSGLLTFVPIEDLCGDEFSGCSIVQNSKYKETLGINNSYSGIAISLLLIIIIISNTHNPKRFKRYALNSLVTVFAAAAAYFIYLQLFVIKAICQYCMVIDIGGITALAIIIIFKK